MRITPASQIEWPDDEPAALARFYGAHVLDGATPSDEWQDEHLVQIDPPYTLHLAWDSALRVRKITCHRRIGPYLLAAMEDLRELGTEFLAAHGLHAWGGCYNYRPVRGGSRLSVHAWAAAIDLAPQRNPLGRPYRPNAGMMPPEAVEILRRHGARWGGEWRRPDCMHFQWTR